MSQAHEGSEAAIYEAARTSYARIQLNHVPVRPGTITLYGETIFGMPVPTAGAFIDDGNGHIVVRQADGNTETVGSVDYDEGVIMLNIAYISQQSTPGDQR